MSVYVIDEMMGRGKTTAAIRHVNESPDGKRFLFVVPYLTEVERILEQCTERRFYAPLKDGGKLNNIKPLLKEGRDVVSTHALFQMLDAEALEYIRDNQYTLIMDEVADVASQINITDKDAELILGRYAHVGDDKRLCWDDPSYEGKLSLYKDMMDAGNAYIYSENYWVSFTPIELFLAFEDIYIMTYMFTHQMHRCYFDLFDIRYQYKYVAGDSPETYCLTDTVPSSAPLDLCNLIRIEDNYRLNEIGDGYHNLSKTWYRRNLYKPAMNRLGNNVLNFFRNYARTPSRLNLWTTFGEDELTGIDYFKVLAGGGFARSGLSCNAKGTNDYRDRTSLAYLINRFPHTSLYNFLHAKGIELNRDAFALSEMVQWIWRSAVRDGQEVYLYMPSRRMRGLLTDWMDRLAAGEPAFPAEIQ